MYELMAYELMPGETSTVLYELNVVPRALKLTCEMVWGKEASADVGTSEPSPCAYICIVRLFGCIFYSLGRSPLSACRACVIAGLTE